MQAYMDRESQNKRKSLRAWCMIYYSSRVFFDCGWPVQFNNLNSKAIHAKVSKL